MVSFFHRAGWLVALLCLASCHNAPRTNPFDPALTPPVALQVALDDRAGTATLTWSQYEGQQPFREYRVLRNIADRKSVDTLAHLPAVAQITFVDTTLAPNTAYVYRVETVNAGGYAAPSEEKGVAGFSVGAVRLLEVEGDQDSGGLVLRWNRYVGPDFASYQVRRRVVGTDREETLAETSTPTDTSFIDQTAQAGVEYVYTVVIAAAGQTLLSNTQETRLVLPPVEIVQADFNSAQASASLTWTRYQGLRFKGYQVRRRTAEQVAQTVKETADIADTSLVDPGLLGNTEYFYQVVVLTERGEEVKSEEKTNAFHRLVGTFPLEGASRPGVRLNREGDRIAALVIDGIGVADFSSVQLLFFDRDFQQLDEHNLLNSSRNWAVVSGARSMSMAQNPAGQHLVSTAVAWNVVSRVTAFGILSFGADGEAIAQEYPLFADAFPAPLPGVEGKVGGEIALLGYGRFDNVTVSTGERLLFAEDFSAFTAGADRATEAINGWEFSTPSYFLDTRNGQNLVSNDNQGVARKAKETWQNFRLEADVVLRITPSNLPTLYGIQVGGDTFSRFRLQCDFNNQQVLLNWDFSPPAELDLEAQHQTVAAPFPIITGIASRLSLEVVDGQVRATAKSPVLWGSAKGSTAIPIWSNLAALGNSLACTVDEQAYSLTPTGQATPLSSFPSRISELRVWEASNGHGVGVCLPEDNQILTGRVPTTFESQWSTYISKAVNIGPRIGPEQGYLFYPLSFDVGPDGRFYVLDAGNARIVVFDRQRKYITQWGRKGDGLGEFNFGSGEAVTGGPRDLDFAGSLAVDSQGYIYVAEEINQRIQRFAP